MKFFLLSLCILLFSQGREATKAIQYAYAIEKGESISEKRINRSKFQNNCTVSHFATSERKKENNLSDDPDNPKYNELAIFSLVLGALIILSFLLIAISPLLAFITVIALSVANLFLSIMALFRTSNKNQKGMGFAVFGIIASGLGLFFGIIGLIIWDLANSCEENENSCNCV